MAEKEPGESVSSLYRLCILRLLPLLEKIGKSLDWDRIGPRYKGILDDLASSVVEDLLLEFYRCSSALQSDCKETCVLENEEFGDSSLGRPQVQWNDNWRVCLTPKIRAALGSWSADLLKFMSRRCPSLRRLWVLGCDVFHPGVLKALPSGVLTVDLDGQLFFRGRDGLSLQGCHSDDRDPKPWLVEAEQLFRALHTASQKVPEFTAVPKSGQLQLVELHLGEAHANAAQIKEALRDLPQLRLLRHYQLVTALYQQHAAAWRAGEKLPTYKLRNLDVDFSHVVRCRMSPEPVLAPDALQLAALLCPAATQVRVRFDPQTPHDVLAPLTALSKVRSISAVCVSSGQRAHLDYSDIAALLEHHGSSVHTLELKVIEEVDVHSIISLCPKLEELVLSGCGNVVPSTCSSWGCNASKPELAPLKKLRLLFYADGDDFSWDHDVPQCFWKWTLVPAIGYRSHLDGIFLESPRMAPETLDFIFRRPKAKTPHRGPLFPYIQVLSICRAPEISPELLAAMCGVTLSPGASKISTSTSFPTGLVESLRYVRAHQCKRLGPVAARNIKASLKAQRVNAANAATADVTVVID